ncbi:MAG: hypothetical protein MUE44_02595 [Oscillatoriaceae cyanobacterium Prado104]|nr:hypothetical protein [Oscillatoriaceae cyanobacterium Prado104]
MRWVKEGKARFAIVCGCDRPLQFLDRMSRISGDRTFSITGSDMPSGTLRERIFSLI